MMKSALCVVLTFALALADPFHDGFVVKWSNSPTDANAFYTVPRTSADAVSGTDVNAWVEVEAYTVSKPYSVFCQPDNERFCIVFDKNGIVAGMQYGIPFEDVANNVHKYPFDTTSVFNKMTRFGRDTWVSTVFFVNKGVLDAGGRNDLSQGTIVEYWQQQGPSYKDVVQIPLDRAALAANTLYQLENCVPGMGLHYYYNITSTLPCEKFFPWFQLYKDEQITGIGFQSFGKSVVRPSIRHYDEEVPLLAVLYVLNDPPQCIRSWVTDDTVISLHVYFVSKPFETNSC